MKGLDNHMMQQKKRQDQDQLLSERVYDAFVDELEFIGYTDWMIKAIDLDEYVCDYLNYMHTTYEPKDADKWIADKQMDLEIELNEYLHDKYYNRYKNDEPIVQ